MATEKQQVLVNREKSPTKAAKAGGLLLPQARIRTIMKSSPDVTTISNDSLFLVTRAAEIFIENLAICCAKESPDPANVTYRTLSNIVADDDNLQFLQDIIPQKIKGKDYIEMMRKNSELVIVDSDDST